MAVGILELLDESADKLCYVCWESFTPGPKPGFLGLMFYNVCPGCKAKYPDREELQRVRIRSMQERREFLRSQPGEAGAFHRMLDNMPRSMPSSVLFRHEYKEPDDG